MNDLSAWFEHPPERRSLSIDGPVHMTAPAEVWRALAGIVSGWVCLPHEVRELPLEGGTGPIEAAEGVTASGESIHVRRTGAGWSVWTYRDEEGGQDLSFDERYGGNGPTGLRYRVFWRRVTEDGIEVFRPLVARFLGFDGQGG